MSSLVYKVRSSTTMGITDKPWLITTTITITKICVFLATDPDYRPVSFKLNKICIKSKSSYLTGMDYFL